MTKNVMLKATTCDPTYNWYSCISLSLSCKFVNNQCVSVDANEKCSDLSTPKAFVSALVC